MSLDASCVRHDGRRFFGPAAFAKNETGVEVGEFVAPESQPRVSWFNGVVIGKHAPDRVEARAAELRIRLKPAASRCGFRGFSRAQVDANLPALKALLGRNLRFNSPAAPD